MQVLTIVLLMICNGQNPGLLTSGTFQNKFSKMPPPTSMHLWTRCRLLRVARRSSWRRSFIRTHGDSLFVLCDVSCDVIYYVIAVRARRMVRIFFLPYLGNRSKSDPCSYELFCLESHILSFPKVLQIPPESPCILLIVSEKRVLLYFYANSVYCLSTQINLRASAASDQASIYSRCTAVRLTRSGSNKWCHCIPLRYVKLGILNMRVEQ